MRKPLVVVGVAAVLLGAGTIVATRAGAQESPPFPDVPGLSLSDLPGLSPFGGGSDAGGPDAAGGSGGTDGSPAGDGWALGSDLVGGAAADQGDGSGGGNRDGSAPVDADGSSADGGDSSADGGDGSVAGDDDHGGGSGRPGATDRPGPAARPVRQRPAFAQSGVVRQPGFAQQTGSGLLAASRRDVTAADISASPSAPVQQQVLALVNVNRREHGCGDLSLDRRLIEAANGHAADMARHDYFAHESRDGDGPGDRVTGAGYRWRRYGENIARGVDSPYAVVDGWMHSPEHRHNILDCQLDQMGIGLAIAGDRTTYWVQDFGTPQ